MSTVFFTSDQHIGHAKIAELRAQVFGGPADAADAVGWHDAELARRWDAVVTDQDTVWVLGDISSGGSTAQRAALAWFAARPGRKHLISGNHDGVHPSNRDFHRWLPAYAEVFASVSPFARQRVGRVEVMLSHFPYTGDHTDTDRMVAYRLRDTGMAVLHGHTHADHPGRGREIHVGVDARDLTPVHTDVIAAQLRSCAAHLD